MVGLTVGVALTVALTALLGSFFASSEATMTQRAARAVAVDWQVQLAPGTRLHQSRATIARAPGVKTTAPVEFGKVVRFSSTTGRTHQTAGAGDVLGIPSSYSHDFPGEIRYLVGAHSGVLLAQQTAANLHVQVGSNFGIGLPGGGRVPLKVAGIIDLPAADSLFQTVGAPPSAGITAPPDNVVLLPSKKWHELYDPVLKRHPAAGKLQVHVGLSRTLPPDPGAAFSLLTGRALNLEASLAGKATVGDNLGAQLDAARADAVYGRLLFLLLGLPGPLLAGALTMALAWSGRARRRTEQALLRMRGMSLGAMQRLAMLEGLGIGIVGSIAGALLAAGFAPAVFSTRVFGPTRLQSILWLVASIVAGLVVAIASIALPARGDARRTVMQARKSEVRSGKPWWERLQPDLVLLAVSGFVFWEAVKSGYQVVLAPEGVPTISIDYFTLLAPVCLWVGAALLVRRLSRLLLVKGRPIVAKSARPVSGGLAGVVAATMSRQHPLLTRGLQIVALTVTFALSTAIFDSTFAAQSRVDAQLTNGSDVTVTTAAASGLAPNLAKQVDRIGGVSASESMQHRFAYVGNDLQDLYGIDAQSFGRAAPLSNAFFAGGNVTKALSTLASRPDGVMVSDETVADFRLQLGDLIRLRLQSGKDHAYHTIPFHYVGIVREFPTAPRDSFIVANASYVAAKTQSGADQTLLVKTDGSPPAVASKIRQLVPPGSGPTVTDINHQLSQTLSGLPAIDLSGLSKIELAFAVALAAGATGLVLALGLAERRRLFAITSALGARRRQIASFVWAEAAYVTIGGLLLGALIGWGVSYMLVKILTGVFDPPPDHLDVPGAYLSVVGVTMFLTVFLAARTAIASARRGVTSALRDL